MPKKIDADEVKKVALLSRLALTEAEIQKYAGHLGAVLEYFEKMKELDTSQVEPLAHCLPINSVLRPDRVKKSLDTEKALANAPDRNDGLFRVPRILDENSGA